MWIKFNVRKIINFNQLKSMFDWRLPDILSVLVFLFIHILIFVFIPEIEI